MFEGETESVVVATVVGRERVVIGGVPVLNVPPSILIILNSTPFYVKD